MCLIPAATAFGDERPENLASLEARPAPEWLKRGVIYQIWLRSFTPEGTLKAASKRLANVAELGATIVYLSPIMLQDDDMRREFWSPRQCASGTNNPRNPYRIKDFSKIDPEYGTDADLKEFVETAHKQGLHVLLDLVYYHMGPTNVLLEKNPDFAQRKPAGEATSGPWRFPKLNFENKELREYLWANMAHWVRDFGVDGFRCDVADHVPLDFWEEARIRLTPLRQDLVLLAEGSRQTNQIKAFDICYSFAWYFGMAKAVTGDQSASQLRLLWTKHRDERPRGSRFLRFSENHDFVSDQRRADVVFSERGADALSVINFTIDGVPFLFNGQEIGDTTVESIFASWPIRWEASCLPKPKARFAFFQKLCKLRQDERALTDGKVVWLENDRPEDVVSYLRSNDHEEILVVVNLSNRKRKVRITPADRVKVSYKTLLKNRADTNSMATEASLGLGSFGYFVGKKQ